MILVLKRYVPVTGTDMTEVTGCPYGLIKLSRAQKRQGKNGMKQDPAHRKIYNRASLRRMKSK
jgi:hypothetical protein